MNTNSIPYLNEALRINDALLGLPALPLVLLGCIAIGYLFKSIPVYPNSWIPAGVFAAGILLNLWLSGFKDGGRALILGLIAGGLAIIAHRKLLKNWIDERWFKDDGGPDDPKQGGFVRLPLLVALAMLSGLVIGLLTGCGTLTRTAITLTEVEASAMKEWARLHNDGRTSPDLDRRVMEAHETFRKAGMVAAGALRAYEAGGDQGAYVQALTAARAALLPLLDLLEPFITRSTYQKLNSEAVIAPKP